MEMKDIQNKIVTCYGGSIAYGTNTPESDIDIRGIFCADEVSIRTPFFPIREVNLEDQEDGKMYELTNFMKLYCDMNPNILELLWVDESDILETSEAYKLLRHYAPQMLSKKVAFTFTGYALQQMKRIKGHNKWINNPQKVEPPVRVDYVKLQHNFTDSKLQARQFSLRDYNYGYLLVPYGNDIYGLINADQTCNTYNKDGSIKKFDYDFFRDEQKKQQPLMIVKLCEEDYKRDKETHSNYWTWKKNRNESRSSLEEKYGFDCYSGDTEFLTDSGFKSFDNITEKDLLATFNKDSEIEYHKYSEKFDSKYNGNMYHYTGTHYDCYVTANHQMVFRPYERNNGKPTHDNYVKAPAAEMPSCVQVLATPTPKTHSYKTDEILKEIEDVTSEQYISIMGWYLSDGSSYTNPKGYIRAYISQSKNSQLMQNAIKLANKGLMKRYKTKITKGGLQENIFTIRSDIARKLVTECGHGSKDKRIPNYMFNQTKRHMEILLRNMLYGDGTKRELKTKDNVYVYYTTNTLLADDVQRLGYLCGFVTAKWGPYTFETQHGTSVMYQVHIDMSSNQNKILYKQNLKIEKVSDLRVVCFTVPNHTLVTRRNGKISMHGNCKHASHVARLIRMGEEILTEGIVRVKRPDAKELLAIRNGEWSYAQLLDFAEGKDKLIRETLYKTSHLPKTVDQKLAAKVLMEAQDLCWNK